MFELSFHSLPAETTVQGLGDIQLETFAVAHGGVPTLGLQLTGESGTGSSVVYSSDTEPCDAVWRRSHSARLLVHECSSVTEPSCAGHTALAELEAQLPSDGSVEVRLVHLPPMDEALAAAVTARLAARFGGRVRLASDGELWERDAP